MAVDTDKNVGRTALCFNAGFAFEYGDRIHDISCIFTHDLAVLAMRILYLIIQCQYIS